MHGRGCFWVALWALTLASVPALTHPPARAAQQHTQPNRGIICKGCPAPAFEGQSTYRAMHALFSLSILSSVVWVPCGCKHVSGLLRQVAL